MWQREPDLRSSRKSKLYTCYLNVSTFSCENFGRVALQFDEGLSQDGLRNAGRRLAQLDIITGIITDIITSFFTFFLAPAQYDSTTSTFFFNRKAKIGEFAFDSLAYYQMG